MVCCSMLNKNVEKILYLLSSNSKIKQKKIASSLRQSPQLINYLLEKLKIEKKIFNPNVIIDPSRFGLVNIILIFVITTFDQKKIEEILNYLQQTQNIVYIEKISIGSDLLVEYSVENLSQFNKFHTIFIQKFYSYIKTKGTFPVIVKHIYKKDYLSRKKSSGDEIIICGDRKTINLDLKQYAVLEEVKNNPELSYSSLSQKVNLDTRTVSKIMKYLEDQKIIRGYSIDLDYQLLNLSSVSLLISAGQINPLEFDTFIEFSKSIPEIVSITKLIGVYSFLIRIESKNNYNLVLKKIRERFLIYDYLILENNHIVKNCFLPSF